MTSFIVCRTCGRYLPAGEAVNRAFCSEQCTSTFTSCSNCGTYFRSGTGVDSETCSRECAVHYQILRRYGPQPVTVVTEV